MRLERDFYTRNTLIVARELVGKILVKDGMSGIITEVEVKIRILRMVPERFVKPLILPFLIIFEIW